MVDILMVIILTCSQTNLCIPCHSLPYMDNDCNTNNQESLCKPSERRHRTTASASGTLLQACPMPSAQISEEEGTFHLQMTVHFLQIHAYLATDNTL